MFKIWLRGESEEGMQLLIEKSLSPKKVATSVCKKLKSPVLCTTSRYHNYINIKNLRC